MYAKGMLELYKFIKESKTNTELFYLLKKDTKFYVNEIKRYLLFKKKRDTFSGKVDKNTSISFINRKLAYTAALFNINLYCHSFRIYFVTSLLRLAPIQDSCQLIGHQDIKSTMVYNKYNLDKKKAVALYFQGLYKKT
ncbi:hypothetical protein EON73_02120 [bacterium]|nr:MAG: hypothetical protein EON73_02120 [bacterium]